MRRRGLVLAALTRLKQICNHPAHALGDGSRLSGRSGKLARYDELVDELLDVDERALVFTQFREMGELLRRHAAERLELRVPFLHGGVSRARRDAMVADFQAGLGPPLLLVSLKAGGTGLNLTAASQVIHYDRWWNPAVEDQATDRAWRIGQGRTVVVHKLVCEGTVEERIATLHRRQAGPRRRRRRQRRGAGSPSCRRPSCASWSPSTARHRTRRRAMTAPRRIIGPRPPGRLPAAMLRALAAELSDPGRFSRAKVYARDGAVIDIEIEPGEVRSRDPRVALRALSGARCPWCRLTTPTPRSAWCRNGTRSPPTCTCPDDGPYDGGFCKHALAALLVLADEVTVDPQLLTTWRSGPVPSDLAGPSPCAAAGRRSTSLRR